MLRNTDEINYNLQSCPWYGRTIHITKYFNKWKEHPKQQTSVFVSLLCTVFCALSLTGSYKNITQYSTFFHVLVSCHEFYNTMLATPKMPTNMSAYHTTFKQKYPVTDCFIKLQDLK